MPNTSFTDAEYKRLVRVNRKLSAQLACVTQLDATPGRDAVTGAFTKAGTVTAGALRSAWGLGRQNPAGREVFKKQLLAALMTPRK